jgi:PAS domain S-box-containing protein
MNQQEDGKGMMFEGSPGKDSDAFGEIFQGHGSVMLLVEPGSGRIMDANPAAWKFYGYSLEQFRQMTVNGLTAGLPGQTSAEWRSGNSIFLHETAGGEIRTVEANISQIILSGQPALFCILHEINEPLSAQERLKGSELRLHALAEHITAVIYQCRNNDKFTFTYLNDAIYNLTGYPVKAFLEEGLSFFDLYHPDDVALAKAPFTKDFHVTYRIRHKSGGWRWVDEWGVGVVNEHGEAEYIEGIMLDVTAQKRAEEALTASESEMRSLFASMRDVVLVIDRDGFYRKIAPTSPDLLFKPSDELLGKSFIDLFPAGQAQIFHDTVRKVVDTGQAAIIEYSLPIGDKTIWFEATISPLSGDQVLWVARNTTDRKRMETALSESRKLLHESQVIAGLGSYELDISSGVWVSSDVLDKIFGIDEMFPHTVEGWEKLVHPDHRRELSDYYLREVVGNRKRFDRVYKIVRQNDGVERWVHGMGELEFDADGNPVVMRGSIQDVTEQKRSEDILRQRLMELEALHNVSSSLRTAQTFEESLHVLLDQTLSALGTDTGAIMLHDPKKDELRGVYQRGWFEEIPNTIIRVGEGVAGKVFSTGQPHVSVEFVHDPHASAVSRDRIPLGWGGACLPIRAGAEIVGVLFVAVQLPRQVTTEKMKLLRSLTEIAGTALHRARLFDETTRRAQEFESLYETSMVISSEYELDAMLQVIVNTAKKLLNAASSGIYLFHPADDELELAVDTEPYVEIGTRMKMGEGAAGWVAKYRRPLRIVDYSKWEGRSPQYEGIPLRAVLEVPMLYGGELIGVLSVDEYGESEHKYTETDERLLSLFASHAAGAVHAARLRQDALNRLENLQTLRAVDKAIVSSFDLRITLNVMLDHIVTHLGVDAADVLLFHPYSQHLHYSAGRGFRTRLVEGAEVSLSDNFAGRCVLERHILEVLDPQQVAENRPFYRLWTEEGFQNYICVPLIAKGEVKGVLELFQRSTFKRDNEWFEFLETLAGQAAISIDNAQLFDNIQRANMELAIAYEATIEGWSRALEFREHETESHIQRVVELTMALAQEAGIRGEELQSIRRGALLHDIGKMGISDQILLKPGKLTAAEWRVMRTHPTLAYQMLKPIHYLRPALDIPYCHHEKWDGSGYPRGLKGEQIPLPARLFAIADVWDALISPRPYRKAWSKKRAFDYIKNQGGKHFDPYVVEIFLKVLDNF